MISNTYKTRQSLNYIYLKKVIVNHHFLVKKETMSKNNKSNKDVNRKTRDECIPIEDNEIEIIETIRIKKKLESQTR